MYKTHRRFRGYDYARREALRWKAYLLKSALSREIV